MNTHGIPMTEIDWIDLPDDNYIAVLGYETINTINLNALIKKYNQIPKDQILTLSCRIRKLTQIDELIGEWTSNKLEAIDKKKHLIWIAEIASRKKHYLIQLLQMYENNLHEEVSQKSYHLDISNLQDKSKIPVFLNNQRFFSLKLREYWGDFWYETFDPCHRRLTPFLDQWRVLILANPHTPHFFLWLETQHIPKYIPKVTHLKGEALESKKLIINKGLFTVKIGSEWVPANFNTPSKRYLFTIDLSGEIYLSEEGPGISHSSFTSGKPVLGAGLLQISKGELISIALESGHYMPTTDTGHQILKIFEEKGAVFSKELEVVFFYDRNKYKVNFTANPLPSYLQFKKILESAYTDQLRDCREKCTA